MQNPIVPKVGTWEDVKAVFQPKNWPVLGKTAGDLIKGNGLDVGQYPRVNGVDRLC